MREVLLEDLGHLLALHHQIISEKFVVDALIRQVEEVCEYPMMHVVDEDRLPHFRELLQDLHHMELDIEGVISFDTEPVYGL